MSANSNAAAKYFSAIERALNGLDTYLREDDSPLYKHDIVGAIVTEYLERLEDSFESWSNRLSFADKFRIAQTESGFPAYQNVLDLENDRRSAKKHLAALPKDDHIREDMVDYILRKKAFPSELQKTMAERKYLETLLKGAHFSPLVLPKTVRLSVNPKTKRPYYVVHWGYYDGSSNLPIVYMLSVEDSSKEVVETLVGKNGKINKNVDVPLPVDGLLNPKLAHQFDDFCEKNSGYGLSLSTIGTNLDKEF